MTADGDPTRVLDSADPLVIALWASTTAAGAAARALGVPARDGWRAATEFFHRADSARYLISVPGLALPAEPAAVKPARRLARALRAVLLGQPHAHFALEQTGTAVRRVPWARCDVLVVEYSGDDRLRSADLVGDDLDAATTELFRVAVAPALLIAYERHRHIAGTRRPGLLWRALARRLRGVAPPAQRAAALDLGRRALHATWLELDSVAPADRFAGATWLRRPPPGTNVLTLQAAAYSSTRFDLEARVSHIGLDGFPAVALLRRIARELGQEREAPRPRRSPLYTHLLELPRERLVLERGICPAEPLRSAKRRLDAALVARGHKPASWAAVWTWLLATHPRFAEAKFNSPVGVDLGDATASTLEYVIIRPRHYRERGGLLAFCADYERQIRIAQQQRGHAHRFLEDGAYLPAWTLATMPRGLQRRIGELTGSVCVAVLDHVESGWELLTSSIDAMIAVPSRPTPFSDAAPGFTLAATARAPLGGQVIGILNEVAWDAEQVLGALEPAAG